MFITRKPQSLSEGFLDIINKYEYKLLLKLWCGCVLLFGVMGIIVSPVAEFTLKQLNNSLRDNYDYIFFTAHEYKSNNFYYVGNTMDIITSNGNKLQVEIIMQSDKSTYDELSFRQYTNILLADEVAISKNLALKNRLKIGDSIAISYPAFLNEIKVTVIEIFDEAFGLMRPHSKNNVVILGYNPLIAKNTSVFVSFVSDEAVNNDYVYFTQNLKMIDVRDNTKTTAANTVTSLIMPIIILCFIQLFTCYIFTVRICASYYHGNLMFGRCVQLIKKEITIDCFVIYLPVALIALLINTFVIKISFGYVSNVSSMCLFISQYLTAILTRDLLLKRINKTQSNINKYLLLRKSN